MERENGKIPRREHGLMLLCVFLAVALAVVVLRCAGNGSLHRTVPQEVLTDGTGIQPDPRVLGWATEEIAGLSTTWNVPKHTVAVVPPLSWNAISIITPEPVRYSAVVIQWRYPDEGQVRFSTAHEVGHWMLSEAGLPQSEQTADQFALCFGSIKAQEHGRDVRHVTANCEQLRRTLTKTAGRP